jgi:hypothetical protein
MGITRDLISSATLYWIVNVLCNVTCENLFCRKVWGKCAVLVMHARYSSMIILEQIFLFVNREFCFYFGVVGKAGLFWL